MPGTGTASEEKEKFNLTSALPLIRDRPSFSRLLAGSTHVYPSLTRVIRTCLLKQQPILNTPLDMTTPNLDLSINRDENTLSGKCNHFIWIQEKSPPSKWLLNPEIKLKFKRYLGLVSSFLQEFLCKLNKSSSPCRAISMDIPESLSPPSQSSIASGRSSGLHPVSAQSYSM